MNVVGARLLAHENDVLALGDPPYCIVRVEHDAARRSPRARGQSDDERLDAFLGELCLRGQPCLQELLERPSVDSQQRLVLGEHLLANHVDRDPHRGLCRAFGGSGL